MPQSWKRTDLTPEARKRLEGNNPGTDPGSASNLGPSSRPLLSLDLTQLLGAQIALHDALTIGQSSDMLVQAARSLDGGICCCAVALSRAEVGGREAWKDTSWVPVIFMPSLPSLKRLPGRAWMLSGWSTGYLKCKNCGAISAVVSAALSGSVVVSMLHATFLNTAPKPTKRAR